LLWLAVPETLSNTAAATSTSASDTQIHNREGRPD